MRTQCDRAYENYTALASFAGFNAVRHPSYIIREVGNMMSEGSGLDGRLNAGCFEGARPLLPAVSVERRPVISSRRAQFILRIRFPTFFLHLFVVRRLFLLRFPDRQ
jgi:hypothetical protein